MKRMAGLVHGRKGGRFQAVFNLRIFFNTSLLICFFDMSQCLLLFVVFIVKRCTSWPVSVVFQWS